jgi:fatty-acyl-CoA synthase
VGLLTNIFLSRIKVPRDIHRYAFRKYADRTALQFANGAMTYAQLQDRSYRLTQALQNLGLKKGDAIFAQVNSGPEFFEIRTATLETGIVLTVFHALHTREFVADAALKVRPKLFIVDDGFAPQSKEVFVKAMPDTPVWGTGPDSYYEQQVAAHDPAPSEADVRHDDPMGLAFTSGTTGPPKGLISSHGAAVASLKLIIRNLKIKPDRKKKNISLPSIPLVGAGSGLIFPSFLSGGTLVVMDEYGLGNLLKLVKKHRVTRLFLTPSHLIDLLDMPTENDADLATVSHIIYGTSNMPAAKLEEALNRFNAEFQQGYGQAEVLPPVSLLTPEMHLHGNKPAPREVLRSCGKVVKGVKVRIMGSNGDEEQIGQTGEIHVNTPTRLQTYLDPEQNKGVILDGGWFRTGDHGHLDHSGYLHVTDREADIVHTENGLVYPRRIEEETHSHPAVKECCLVEIDRKPVLFISLRSRFHEKDETEIINEIAAFLNQQLAPTECPREIHLLPEIPRSFLGKVMRREVKERMQNAFNK